MHPSMNTEVGVVGELSDKHDGTEITSECLRFQEEKGKTAGCTRVPFHQEAGGETLPRDPGGFGAAWWFPNGTPGTQNAGTTIRHCDKGNIH